MCVDFHGLGLNWFQRFVGYCLTHHVHEHVLLFLYGKGGNGKSVFISTVAGIFNSYSLTAPMGMFLVSKFERLQKRSALSKMDNKELKYIDRYIHQSLF